MSGFTYPVAVSFELWGGIFCLLAAVTARASREADRKKGQRLTRILLLNALMAGCSFLQCVLETALTQQSEGILGLCTTGNWVLIFAIYAGMAGMVDGDLIQINGRTQDQGDLPYDRKWYPACIGMALGGGVFAVLLFMINLDQGQGAWNQTQGKGYFWILMYALACIFILIVELMAEMKKIALDTLDADLVFCFLVVIGIVIELSTTIRMAVGSCVTMGSLVLFMEHQIEIGRREAESRVVIEQQKRRLAEMKTRVMVSQIQPHFLYNSLSAIQYLCRKDPERAAEATKHFSDYLRNDLGSISKAEMIPFTEEMDHVRNYLWLEELRYGDDLEVELDLEEVDFRIPALTVQALTENAVRHGLMQKKMGGKLTICSERGEDSYRIRIRDDGQGFDTGILASMPDRGLANVRERLQTMCGGRLMIESMPDRGTTVTIEIPVPAYVRK